MTPVERLSEARLTELESFVVGERRQILNDHNGKELLAECRRARRAEEEAKAVPRDRTSAALLGESRLQQVALASERDELLAKLHADTELLDKANTLLLSSQAEVSALKAQLAAAGDALAEALKSQFQPGAGVVYPPNVADALAAYRATRKGVASER